MVGAERLHQFGPATDHAESCPCFACARRAAQCGDVPRYWQHDLQTCSCTHCAVLRNDLRTATGSNHSALVAEIERLRRREADLLAENNAELERRRAEEKRVRQECADIALHEFSYWRALENDKIAEIQIGAVGAASNIHAAIAQGKTAEQHRADIEKRDKRHGS